MHAHELTALVLSEPSGQGWAQIIELTVALLLSSLIGLERELGQKNAGLRTHALVGVGAALFMLVSKYGFTDVLVTGKVILDPSRVAAQIVTGIGFIGGGLIFVRRDAVQGLTTAATVWLTAAVGAACGAGLPLLAAVATGGHFLVVQGYPRLTRRFGLSRFTSSTVHLQYIDGRGLLRTILTSTTAAGFSVTSIETRPGEEPDGRDSSGAGMPAPVNDPRDTVHVILHILGSPIVNGLASALSEIDGVLAVTATNSDTLHE